MKPTTICVLCTAKWIFERLTAGDPEKSTKNFDLLYCIFDLMKKRFDSTTNPARAANYIIKELFHLLPNSRPYFEDIKQKSNKACLELLPYAKKFVESARDAKERLKRASAIATLANVAPIGRPNSAFSFSELGQYLHGKTSMITLDERILDNIFQARNITYVLDNAGEVGFDSLLLNEIKKIGSKINIIAKKDYFFDDATFDDIQLFNLEGLSDHVFFVDGIFDPEKTDNSVKNAFEISDLVIAKGTGNFESLCCENLSKNIIFMLKVKCDRIQEMMSVPSGSFVTFQEISFGKQKRGMNE
jgi:uncharacterized protein with ATP-grasp and redox domains